MKVDCCAGGSGGGGGSFTPGPLLSGVGGNNNDTVAQAPTAGSIVFANATPLWDELVVGAAGLALVVVAGLPAWAVLGVAGGGTSFATYATGDILYASAANTLAKRAIGATGEVLTVDATGVPVWAANAPGSGANTALSNLAAVAINTTLVSDTDNTDDLGTAAIGWRTLYLRTSLRLLAAASDANPTLLLSGATIAFGAGGGTAVDASLTRLAAGVLGVTAGNELRFQGSGSGYVGVVSPAAPTSYTITLPTAASATAGFPLTSTTGGVTSWARLTVPAGGTGAATFTAFSVICAGTTATGSFQNVVGVGAAGEILTSNGAGALPTWQANSGGGANTALSNLAAVAINLTLVSDTDNTDDLGTTAIGWRTGYFRTGLEIRAAASDANATAKLSGAILALGAGGASAADVVLSRTAAGLLSISAPAGAFIDTDFSNIANGTLNVFANGTDAQPKASLSASDLSFGAGGASAVDVTIGRAAANIMQLGAGDSLRFQGGTSGTLTLTPAATITSYTLTLPAAQGGASTFLQNDGAGVLSWAAGSSPFTSAAGVVTFTTSTDRLSLVAGAAGTVPLTVKGAASQSASLQEWQTSAGTVFAKFSFPTDQDGIFSLNPAAQVATDYNFAAVVNQQATAGATSSFANFGSFPYRPGGNNGVQVRAVGTTATGQNVGGTFLASSALRNFGGWASTTIDSPTNGINVALAAFSLNTASGGIQLAGYFGLQASDPTYASAALMCDNGATTSDILVARDNGSAKWKVIDGGSMEMVEITAPSAGAANSVRVYAEDNGSGKTRLMALFASGAAQQIAIEP